MSKPKFVAFTGSTRRPPKSRALAEAIAASAAEHLPVDIAVYDVGDAGRGLGSAYLRSELPPEALAIVEALEGADGIIAVTPTYKGSYTGLFKHLIDFIAQKALAGKAVVVGATGAGAHHALIVEHQLKPLFGFFSAIVVAGIYASDPEFAEGAVADEQLKARVAEAGRRLARTIAARQAATEA